MKQHTLTLTIEANDKSTTYVLGTAISEFHFEKLVEIKKQIQDQYDSMMGGHRNTFTFEYKTEGEAYTNDISVSYSASSLVNSKIKFCLQTEQ